MRRDSALLLDMRLACRQIQRFTADMSEPQFVDNDLVQSAVMRELIVIGEAAAHVSPEFQESHDVIPWRAIVGLRNRVVHEYFRINSDILWGVIQNEVPALIRHLDPLIPPDDEETATP